MKPLLNSTNQTTKVDKDYSYSDIHTDHTKLNSFHADRDDSKLNSTSLHTDTDQVRLNTTSLHANKVDTRQDTITTNMKLDSMKDNFIANEVDGVVAWPEPEPSWDMAYRKWGILWEIYAATFAALFFVITVWTILSLVVNRMATRMKNSKSIIALHLMMFSCFFTRFLFLTVAAVYKDVHFFVLRILYTLGTPGFTAAYMNLVIIIIDSTRSTQGSPRYLKFRFVLSLYMIHLSLAIFSDIMYIVTDGNSKYLSFINHMVFVIYGYLTCFGFKYASYYLLENLKASRGYQVPSNSPADPSIKRLEILLNVIYTCAIVSFCQGSINLYQALSNFGMFSDETHLNHWQWLIVHSVKRFFEFFSGVLVLLAFMNTKFNFVRKTVRRWTKVLKRTESLKYLENEVTTQATMPTGQQWIPEEI